ncbi:Light-harvesting complex-like protein 3 isotype 1 [Chlorella vulgaris]
MPVTMASVSSVSARTSPSPAVARRRVVCASAPSDNGAGSSATLQKDRKPSPLQRGGTLQGAAAAGKDASDKFKSMAEGKQRSGPVLQMVDGRFSDFRWTGGRWDLSLFRDPKTGGTSWDAVIDAEMARRKLLEDSPIACTNEDPVLFDTAEIPWWAWVRRFHLPEAEKLNGRAAMVGYVLALGVDQLTGVGLLDQQNSFFGKVLLHVAVFGILLIRSSSDVDRFKGLIDEAFYYDKQWQSTWEGQERPSSDK